jgi:hypothetical protein
VTIDDILKELGFDPGLMDMPGADWAHRAQASAAQTGTGHRLQSPPGESERSCAGVAMLNR